MAKSKVLENVVALRGFLQSMDCAIGKAERGSNAEDMYFMEKLDKMCACLNLIPVKRVYGIVSHRPERPRHQAIKENNMCKPKETAWMYCRECKWNIKYKTGLCQGTSTDHEIYNGKPPCKGYEYKKD